MGDTCFFIYFVIVFISSNENTTKLNIRKDFLSIDSHDYRVNLSQFKSNQFQFSLFPTESKLSILNSSNFVWHNNCVSDSIITSGKTHKIYRMV